MFEKKRCFEGQLNPGKLLLVDFNSNKVIENNELKTHIAHKYPYKDWIDQYKIDLELDEVQYQRQLLDFR